MTPRTTNPSEPRDRTPMWNMPRQKPTQPFMFTGRGDATPRTREAAARAEAQKAEDWASDCLFDCYNH